MLLEQDDFERILGREELTLEDVTLVMRSVRHSEHDSNKASYANTLLSGAGEYLPAYALTALVDKQGGPCAEKSFDVYFGNFRNWRQLDQKRFSYEGFGAPAA
ncbi:hypothetical protein ACFFWD_17945 [Bradyrhizobium erythrophlei]|uniref:hypothetical protein n=1 Tax=Bradyrhizobium erythrophlei TaxID=1437360 RepID=UPI0035E9F3C1